MQQTPTTQQTYSDDEINLIELWQILVKRKAWVLACFVVCALAGVAYGQLKAPIFESTIALRIGQVQASLLESPQELVARLADAGTGAIKSSVTRGTNNLVTVTALSGSAHGAALALEAAVERILSAHDVVYKQSTQPIRERVAQTAAQRQAVEQELVSLDQLAQRLRGTEPLQASLLVMQRTPLTQSLLQLDAERLQLLQQLSPPQTRPTEMLGQISAPSHPSQPKKWLILALAAMLGLVGGVMLAFVTELVANAKANTKPTVA
jgi:uncharacterized protein involved in exopolysaccharide biosynthesis